MKKLLLASMGVLALGIASASAADLPRRAAPAPIYTPVPVYNWTGFYVGINGGGAFGHASVSNAFGSQGFDADGGLVGGTLGYNWQVGQWVLGIEGDIDWADIRGSTSNGLCFGGTCSVKNDWLATVRGRIGYAFDRFMPYITGGGAFGDVKTSVPAFGGQTNTQAGWTAGAGLEFAINGPWTAKVEYLYVDLGKDTCDTGSCGIATTTDFHTNIVRAGFNYRF
ncbi:MAG TPA: outer membrane protein [Pseudolabrys sp.]|nr:outer membrane protein [Pseudolabrys sp.]